MISHISIKDFAIIESLDVDLYPGFSVITGETGAGKSIIIEAISMALGARADTTMVRAGHNKSIIQLVSDTPYKSDQDDIVISREISSSGKSLCKFNGKIMSLAELIRETDKLADIHGQYDHQSLLDKENHIDIIDAYGREYIVPVKEKVSEIYKRYSEVNSALNNLLKRESDSKRELDFLRFEINEIDGIKPISGEDNILYEKIKLLKNGEKIHDRLAQAYSLLRDISPSTLDQLGNVMNSLKDLSDFSSDFKTMEESVSESYYQLDELSNTIRDHMDKADYSKEVLNEAMERLDALERLKSKYGGSLDKVLEFRNESADKLKDIENIDDKLMELRRKLSALKEDLSTQSRTLSNLRKEAAEELSKKIQRELNELNFSDSHFEVDFAPLPANEDRFSANGTDDAEFLLSANKGLPPLPLAKVASGGEMSRIMLALKTVTGDYDMIPTMIFDEIDSGISGIAASIVGEKLLKMSEGHQIICITHLPQIAAFADHHYVIRKSSDDKTTYTTVNEISGDEQVDEIARLLGGKNITENTLKSAAELIRISGENPQ